MKDALSIFLLLGTMTSAILSYCDLLPGLVPGRKMKRKRLSIFWFSVLAFAITVFFSLCS